jgi:hypothetical protein
MKNLFNRNVKVTNSLCVLLERQQLLLTELMHENTITVPTPVLFIVHKSGFLCTFESTRSETPL